MGWQSGLMGIGYDMKFTKIARYDDQYGKNVYKIFEIFGSSLKCLEMFGNI